MSYNHPIPDVPVVLSMLLRVEAVYKHKVFSYI